MDYYVPYKRWRWGVGDIFSFWITLALALVWHFLVCMIPHEPVCRFSSNLQAYIIGTYLKANWILVILTSFSRPHYSRDNDLILKATVFQRRSTFNPKMLVYYLLNWWMDLGQTCRYITGTVHRVHRFGNLGRIFKVSMLLRMWEVCVFSLQTDFK